MKVIHCLNHFLPKNVAGTEVYVFSLCKQLQKLNAKVSVLIPNYDSESDTEYDYEGIPVYRYAEPSANDRSIITGNMLPKGLVSFSRHLSYHKPDIVHFHEISGSNGIGVAHFEAAKYYGARVIFTVHLSGNSCRTGTLMFEEKTLCDGLIKETKCGYCALQQKTGNRFYAKALSLFSVPFFALGINPINWQNQLGTSLSYPFQIKKIKTDLRRIINACDKIIPITNWYYNILLANGLPDHKLKVIHQALAVSPIESPAVEITDSHVVKLIFVGRIDQLKGISLLVQSLKDFKQGHLVVDVFGVSPEPAYLEACKIEMQGNSNIQWKGELSKELVVSTMKGYEALILPSIFSEMSPLVIQEAFAAGIPVIGSNVYGIAELIQNGYNGLLFEFGNANSLIAVLNKVIADKWLLKKLATNIDSPRKFNQVAEETMAVYQSVL